jgi:hypothetical protein
MTEAEKDAIALRVREMVEAYWPGTEKGYGTCVHHSLVGMLELKRHGIAAQIQAGTLNWPVIEPEGDDGVCPTHFGMVWSPHEDASRYSMATGGIPEMHVWLGDAETQTLIDFSTYQLKELCTNTVGLQWDSADPPEYLWTQRPPNGVQYVPHVEAIGYTYSLLKPLWETRRQGGL